METKISFEQWVEQPAEIQKMYIAHCRGRNLQIMFYQLRNATGVQLIEQERKEQIEKHGWDLSNDRDYEQGELLMAAQFCLNVNNDLLWPWRDSAIGMKFMNKIIRKSPTERIVIAGAFCAAELDRLQFTTRRGY